MSQTEPHLRRRERATCRRCASTKLRYLPVVPLGRVKCDGCGLEGLAFKVVRRVPA